MGKKILIIDDDPVVVKMVEKRLKANGYEPLTAQEAPVGLEIALQKQPDLIILDIMMPIINGYNLCAILRSEEKTKRIPIILLTSRMENKDKAIGQQVGADAYNTKPVNMEELLNDIAFLLKNKK